MFTTPVAVEVILTEGEGVLWTGVLVSLMKDWMALTDSSVSSPMIPLADTTRAGLAVVFFCVTDPEGEMTRALPPRPATPPMSMIIPPPLDTPGLLTTPPRPRGVPRNGGPIRIGMGVFLLI